MNNGVSIRNMQPDYRPDEKFLKYGPQSLTGAELLAIILRTGSTGQSSVELTADILRSSSGNCEDLLNIYNLSLSDLIRIKGIGRVKALQIKSVAELSKRISSCRSAQQLDFSNPQTIAQHYMEQLRHRKREVVLLLLLNSSFRLIKDIYLSEGTVNASLVSPRDIFIEAVRHEAVYIIILHNHPGGTVAPSDADKAVTSQLCEAGKILGISLLDHIIIGDMEYCSFRQKGLINE